LSFFCQIDLFVTSNNSHNTNFNKYKNLNLTKSGPDLTTRTCPFRVLAIAPAVSEPTSTFSCLVPFPLVFVRVDAPIVASLPSIGGVVHKSCVPVASLGSTYHPTKPSGNEHHHQNCTNQLDFHLRTKNHIRCDCIKVTKCNLLEILGFKTKVI